MRSLYPESGETEDGGSVYKNLELPDIGAGGSGDLPFVFINMVSSLDGKVSVSGKSGAIGSDEDRTAMRELRARADAVMVGSGTLRAERVSLTSDGMARPEPLAVIVSSSLNLPMEENFADGVPDRTLILTTEKSLGRLEREDRRRLRGLTERAVIIECEPDKSGGVDMASALRKLRSEHRVKRLLVEGGPGLNHRLISQGLVCELFFTLSPQILGGNQEESLNIASGVPLKETAKAELISIHESNSELFLRYTLSGSSFR